MAATTTYLLQYLLLITALSLSTTLLTATANKHSTTTTTKVHKRAMLENPTEAIAQFLHYHNRVRAKHKIAPLQWDSKLANYAKWYGDQRRADCKLVHSDSPDFGEKIFWGQGKRWKVKDAVRAWAVQENFYDYKNNTCMPDRDCLHYTQMVWRESKYLGCSKTRCKNGDTYVVCEYFPYGNIIGEKPY